MYFPLGCVLKMAVFLKKTQKCKKFHRKYDDHAIIIMFPIIFYTPYTASI